ncbi:hypothetical protein EMIT048CA2_80249 [Pseudomonas chlororaphis]
MKRKKVLALFGFVSPPKMVCDPENYFVVIPFWDSPHVDDFGICN